MAYTLACRDARIDCPNVAHSETEEEVLQEGLKHVKEAHGFTDEQLSDPKFIEDSKKLTNDLIISEYHLIVAGDLPSAFMH